MPILRAGTWSNNKKNAGFSLIELTIIIFLLGLVSYIVFPQFGNSLSNHKFRSSVNKLVGLIQDLRNKTIITKLGYHLNFDLDENEFWIEERIAEEDFESGNIFSKKKKTKVGEYIKLTDIIVPELGKVFGGEVFIRFFPTGYVDRSVIHLENLYNSDMVYTILIKPLTGRVIVKEGYVEKSF